MQRRAVGVLLKCNRFVRVLPIDVRMLNVSNVWLIAITQVQPVPTVETASSLLNIRTRVLQLTVLESISVLSANLMTRTHNLCVLSVMKGFS